MPIDLIAALRGEDGDLFVKDAADMLERQQKLLDKDAAVAGHMQAIVDGLRTQLEALRAAAVNAIERAAVFDDGTDGADAESARSVVAILRGALAPQPADPLGLAPLVQQFNEAPAEALRPEQSAPAGEREAWTANKPTEPGAYWVRGNGLEDDALVQVKFDDGELWCNLHMRTTEPDFGYGYSIEQLSDSFEWLGPLHVGASWQRTQSAPPASPEGRECPRYVCRKCKQETRPPARYKPYVLCDCGYMTSATTALAAAPAQPAAQELCKVCKGFGRYQDGDSGTDADGRAPNIVDCDCADSERLPQYRAAQDQGEVQRLREALDAAEIAVSVSESALRHLLHNIRASGKRVDLGLAPSSADEALRRIGQYKRTALSAQGEGERT